MVVVEYAGGLKIDTSKRYYIRLLDVPTYRFPTTLLTGDSPTYDEIITIFSTDSYRYNEISPPNSQFVGDALEKHYSDRGAAMQFEVADDTGGLYIRHADTGRYLFVEEDMNAVSDLYLRTTNLAKFTKDTKAKTVVSIALLANPETNPEVLIKLKNRSDRYLSWLNESDGFTGGKKAAFKLPRYSTYSGTSWMDTQFRLRLDTHF